MFFGRDDSGALDRPEMNPDTFSNPRIAAGAATFLGAFLFSRTAAFRAIKESSKTLQVEGFVNDMARGVRRAWRDAQIQTMVPVSGGRINRAAIADGIEGLGDHDDIELIGSLREVLTTRERLKRMASGQNDDLLAQTDAELRAVFGGQFKKEVRAGHRSMTVQDVLDMDPAEAHKMFGDEGMDLIQRGIQERVISGSTTLGKGVFRGRDGKILRTDFTTVGAVGRGMKNALNELQIPFINIGLGDIIGAPIQHVAGRSNTMRLVRGVEDPTDTSILIGDKLFNIKKGINPNAADRLGLEFVDDGYNYGVGSVGQGVFARRGQLRSQVIDDMDPQEAADAMARYAPERGESVAGKAADAVGGYVDTVGKAFGFSRANRTSLPWWERLRLAHRRRMDGDLVHDESVRLGQSGPRGSVEDALGRRTGVNPVTGEPITPDNLGNARIPNPNQQEMGWSDKLRSIFGFEVKGAKYVDDLGDDIVGPRVMPTEPRTAKAPALPGENVLRDGLDQAQTTVDGFAYKGNLGSTLQDILHFGSNRLNDLFGFTFGVGFKPSRSSLVAGTQAIWAFAGLSTAAAGAGYADYLVGRTIEAGSLGMIDANDAKPSNIALGLYGVGRGLLQEFREATGISDLARGAEAAAPGIISSDLSNLTRWGLGPAYGMLAKSRAAFGIGLGMSVLAGDDFTGTITDTPEDVWGVLSGEKEVAMRKGRYWEFGKQAYSGGQIGYFTQGFVARQRSNYKMTDTLYGSEEEYYANETWLPTPTNLFGLRKLIEGSKLEDRHILSRPYPGASTGAVQAAMNEVYGEYGGADAKLSMGQGLRSIRSRGEQKLLLTRQISNNPEYASYGADVSVGSKLVQGSMTQSVFGLADSVTEQFGIYRWIAETVGNAALGSERVTKELADANFMSDVGRAFYDEQLGGLGLLSELPRRFMTSGAVRRQRQAYNPLPNLMPDFLPGSRSPMEGDMSYPIDFHTGDAYGKIKHGEMRLPGAAYERMHRLHSGTPGIYDAMDRFLMLSDVAPGSESYKHYKAIVEGWSKSGALDEYWENKLQESQGQAAAKLQVHNFQMRPMDAIMEGMEQGKEFNAAQMAAGFLWEGLAHEILPRVGAAIPFLGGTIENKLLATRDAQATYLNQEIYDTDEYDWAKPYETMIRPIYDSLGSKDPVTAGIGGGITGWLFAANPASKVLFGLASAAYAGGSSSLRALGTGEATGGYIPNHVQERREVDEYFDKIEYMKYRRLEQGAKTMGNFEAAQKYRDLSSRTVAGIDYNLSLEQFKYAAMKAMPKRERAYLEEFFHAKEGDREDILRYLPEHIKPIYEAAYAKQGDERYQERLSQLTSSSADQRVAKYLTDSGRSAPHQDWTGWNPNIEFDAIKYETAMAMGNSVAADIHRMGLTFTKWDSTALAQIDAFDLDITDHFEGSRGLRPDQMFSMESELRAAGMSGVYIDNNTGAGPNSLNYNIHESRLDSILYALDRI